MSRLARSVFLAAAILISGCSAEVFVDGDPRGITISKGGQKLGVTPCKITLSNWDDEVLLDFEAPGYQRYTYAFRQAPDGTAMVYANRIGTTIYAQSVPNYAWPSSLRVTLLPIGAAPPSSSASPQFCGRCGAKFASGDQRFCAGCGAAR